MRYSNFHTAGKFITVTQPKDGANGVYWEVANPVGKIIRRLRVSREITQEALADAIGVSNSQISHIERGERDVDTELLGKIAAALGVSPADLFEGERPAPAPSSVRESGNVYFVMPGKISADERERVEELLKRLAEIPNGDKDLIYDLIETIFKRRRSK